MALSAKHFNTTARILHDMVRPLVDPHDFKGVAEEFADHFEAENPRFDRDRFLAASGTEED